MKTRKNAAVRGWGGDLSPGLALGHKLHEELLEAQPDLLYLPLLDVRALSGRTLKGARQLGLLSRAVGGLI